MTTIDNEHIQHLLPFYVNGTLSEDKRLLVEEALKSDEILRTEASFLRILQAQIKQRVEPSPGEFGLKRLQRSLKEQQDNSVNTQANSHQPITHNYWRVATIAACLILVVQTTINTHTESDVYVAAGGESSTVYKGKIISITFSPNATEEKIRNLLLENGLSIVHGPSTLGVYQLSITSDAKAVIRRLEAESHLIESVQED